MPSLIICGHPCTSKTTFATLLSHRALAHPSRRIASVVHITESAACPDAAKSERYRNSRSEKATRAALKSEFDRAVSKRSNGGSTLVILDSLNYIKGYRYELWCISKAAGERHGTVWIAGGEGVDSSAKERNRRRRELRSNDPSAVDDDGYYLDDKIMDDLVLRFELPDERNRWENPLYKVNLSRVLPWDKNGTAECASNGSDEKDLASHVQSVTVQDDAPTEVKPIKTASGFKRNKKSKPRGALPPSSTQPTTTQSSEALTCPTSMASRNLTASSTPSNEIKTIEQVIDQILQSFLINIQPLKEGMSTALHSNAESDALNRVDAASQRVNSEILRGQKSTTLASGKISISLGERQRILASAEPLSVNELRNYRRQFLKWTASHPMEDGATEEDIGENYVAYIESLISGKSQMNSMAGM